MRTMFMGTPDFGLGCLDVLYEKTDVAGVVSQPDRQKGRGHKLMPTPVKARAEALGIPVFQPERIKGGEFLVLTSSMPYLNPSPLLGHIFNDHPSSILTRIPVGIVIP